MISCCGKCCYSKRSTDVVETKMRYLLPLIIYHLLKFFAVAFFIFLSFLVLVFFCILLSFYNYMYIQCYSRQGYLLLNFYFAATNNTNDSNY
jgi:hypothetical protein